MSTVDLVKRRDSGCTGQPPSSAPTNHKELSSPRYSGGSAGKKFSCNAGQAGDTGSIPRSERKILWRRRWQLTPGFLPGKSHGQRSLAGYNPWGCRVRHYWRDWTCPQISKVLRLRNFGLGEQLQIYRCLFSSSNSHCSKLHLVILQGVWGADSTWLNGGWDPRAPPPTPGLGWLGGMISGWDELNPISPSGDLCWKH